MQTLIHIVVRSWSGLEKHENEFVDCTLDEEKALCRALDLANQSDGTYRYNVLTAEGGTIGKLMRDESIITIHFGECLTAGQYHEVRKLVLEVINKSFPEMEIKI